MKKAKIVVRDERSDNTALFCDGNGSSVLIQFRHVLGIPDGYEDDSYSYCGYAPGLFKDVDELNEAMAYLEWLCQKEEEERISQMEYEMACEEMLYEQMIGSGY